MNTAIPPDTIPNDDNVPPIKFSINDVIPFPNTSFPHAKILSLVVANKSTLPVYQRSSWYVGIPKISIEKNTWSVKQWEVLKWGQNIIKIWCIGSSNQSHIKALPCSFEVYMMSCRMEKCFHSTILRYSTCHVLSEPWKNNFGEIWGKSEATFLNHVIRPADNIDLVDLPYELSAIIESSSSAYSLLPCSIFVLKSISSSNQVVAMDTSSM